MTQQEILEYNKRCALFLGWKETSEQFKIDWLGCKTKERLDKIDKEANIYIPILEKDGDVIFPDFSVINFHSDWNWIMEVVEAIHKLDYLSANVMICQSRCKITPRMAGDHSVYADVNLYFEKGIEGQKEAVVQAINQFLIWYNENN